jgi:O-antigen ligase
MIYGFIHACFCNYTKDAFEEMFTYLTSWLFPLLLGYLVIDNNKKENIIKILILTFTIILAVSVLAYFGLFHQKFAGFRLAEKGMHLQATRWHISCGAMCVLVSCFTLIYGLFRENLLKKYKIILFSLTIFFIICLYLTGSRGYYIAGFIVYFLIFLFYIIKTKKFIIPLFIILVSVLIIAGLYSKNKFMQDRIKNTSVTKEWSLTNRIDSYKAALTIFKNNVLFGVGPRQGVKQEDFYRIMHLSKEQNTKRHLHSMYLNLLAEFGIVGFILFGIIILLIFKNLYISYKEEHSILALCLLFAWISLLIGDCFDTVLRGPRVAMEYFWLTGLVLNKIKK